MAVTPVARIAFAADSGGSSGSKAPRVAKAIDAAFGRFAHPAATYLMIGGDEYSLCTPATMKHYDVYIAKQPNIAAARTVMTPGNHTNGPGGKHGSRPLPSAQAWLDYNRANGTLSRTNGGWINQAEGIPLTDQAVDIAGIRFILLNSGAVENLVDRPGWPVPHTGGSVAGNARAAWLRSAWAPGTSERRHHPSRPLELLRRRPRQPDHAEPDRRDHGEERRQRPALLAHPPGT